MEKQKLYRQGDVLFKRIPSIPSGRQKRRPNGVVAYGEVTGHTHALADVETAEVLEIADRLYVRVSDEGLSIQGEPGATFVHQEHAAISLPPGAYEVVIQREYTPEKIRNVAD